MVSGDFFTVPTIRFQVLYVVLVLAHERRRIVHFNGTAHSTAECAAQQLRKGFPFDEIPKRLLRDRDCLFGGEFLNQLRAMGIEEVLCAPRSPWQKGFVELVSGSIRREYLDRVIASSSEPTEPTHLTRLHPAVRPNGTFPRQRNGVCGNQRSPFPLYSRSCRAKYDRAG
jgi:hypothetical protein